MSVDLAAIDPALLVARGQYATVRAAHEDIKKSIVARCGAILSMTQRISQLVQPDTDKQIDMQMLDAYLFNLAEAVKSLEHQCDGIGELEAQRKTLKELAWPKNPNS